MKCMRSVFLVKLVFLAVMFSFITAGQGLKCTEKAGPPVLARIELVGMWDDLRLPVNTHFQGADGKDYALVIVAVGMPITRHPRTDPDLKRYLIRLLLRVLTP